MASLSWWADSLGLSWCPWLERAAGLVAVNRGPQWGVEVSQERSRVEVSRTSSVKEKTFRAGEMA